jgi:DNA mismatch repair ATPase MutS
MFKDDSIREQVRGMLKKGMKTPEIVAGLPAGSCSDSDVYQLKSKMRQDGELEPSNRSTGGGGNTKSNRKKNQKDEFQQELRAEESRLEEDKERYGRLIKLYENTKTDFALSVEKKLKSVEEKLSLIKELQAA